VVETQLGAVDVTAMRPSERQLDELQKEYRQKLEACRKKEDELQTLAKRVAMEQELLKKQATDLENLQVQLVAPLTRLKEAQAELQRTRVTVAAQEKANLKRTALIYAGMDSAAGGRILTDMCQNNKEDDAAKILFYMQERAAAKLLAEIRDRGLAAKLFDKLKVIKEES
jgi:flagellar motility protein MotE (MotC chaperone)